VERFKTAGKLAVAYADTFGEFAQANFAYYLATAFRLSFHEKCLVLKVFNYVSFKVWFSYKRVVALDSQGSALMLHS
jgi:hypothetical protein